jgi:hypothetical protein
MAETASVGRIQIYLPRPIRDAVKTKAKEAGQSLSGFIEAVLIREVLADKHYPTVDSYAHNLAEALKALERMSDPQGGDKPTSQLNQEGDETLAGMLEELEQLDQELQEYL